MHYVKWLLFRGKESPTSHSLFLSNFTEELDQYYRKIQGVSPVGDKPCVVVGNQTQNLLTFLHEKKPDHWTSLAIELLEFDTPDRDKLLGKLPAHSEQLRDPRAAYALSLTANFEAKVGVAVATSRFPNRSKEIVVGRCREHLSQHNLDQIHLVILALPVYSSDAIILRVTPESQIGEEASRLLAQLEIEVTEN